MSNVKKDSTKLYPASRRKRRGWGKGGTLMLNQDIKVTLLLPILLTAFLVIIIYLL
jgi:hypothetical protein